MSNNKAKDAFDFYNFAAYMILKYSVTGPAIALGNLVDLCSFGIPKRVINVTNVMTNVPFFKEATRTTENVFYNNFSLVNCGFAGLFRAISSLALEIPVTIVAAALAVVFAAIHLILAPIVGPIVDVVSRNMFGC